MSPAIDPRLRLPVYSYYATHYNGETLHALAQIMVARVMTGWQSKYFIPKRPGHAQHRLRRQSTAPNPVRKQTPKLYLN